MSDWETKNNKLTKSFTFKDFAETLVFVNQVGELAEKAEHHPEIWFTWGKAEIQLTTHDAGGITDKDTSLAKQIDGLNS